MNENFIIYPNREEWLKNRNKSIGASEIASIMNEGFNSPLEIFNIKTGRVEPKDLSGVETVRYGTIAEEYIRNLFALKHEKEYKVDFTPFKVFIHPKHSFMTATLDGELTSLLGGKRGAWECKTTTINKKTDLQDWDGRIPQKYFLQCTYQLAVTGYDFVILTAEISFPDGNSEIRNYKIERNEENINYVEQVSERFWGYIERDTPPPVTLNL